MSEVASLRARILELEEEIKIRDSELSRYRQEVRRANATIEKLIHQATNDFEFLKQLQRKLCPVQLPHIPGFSVSSKFVPGQEKGGDYFDLFELSDKMRFAIVLSSASGYGVSSLFLMVLLQLSQKMVSAGQRRALEILNDLVREVRSQMNDHDNAEIFFAILNRRTYELDFCLSPRLGCLLYRAQSRHGQQWAYVESNMEAISRGAETQLVVPKRPLGPGDRLIVLSEGVFQSRTAAQWLKLVESKKWNDVHEIRNEIFYQLRPDPNLKAQRDETVLVLEVNEHVIKLAQDTDFRDT